PSGAVALCASRERELFLLDMTHGRLRTHLQNSKRVQAITFAADAPVFAALREGEVTCWDLPRASPGPEVPPPPDDVQPAGTVAPDAALKPTHTVPLDAVLNHLALSPDGDWLYYLDVTDEGNVRAGRLDTRTREKPRELKLVRRTETLTSSRDARTLYAT